MSAAPYTMEEFDVEHQNMTGVARDRLRATVARVAALETHQVAVLRLCREVGVTLKPTDDGERWSATNERALAAEARVAELEERVGVLSAGVRDTANANCQRRIVDMERDAKMLSDDDDACHRLIDKALGEGSLSTMSMETLLERLPRLIARVTELEALHAANDEEVGALQTALATEIEKHLATTRERDGLKGPDSATWPIVLAFARRMEAKLEKNRHKGNREGWLNMSTSALMKRLGQEMLELIDACARPGLDAQVVIDEAADVANFAMMVADKTNALGGKS